MSTYEGAHAQMLILADHFATRRDAILASWWEKADADASLSTASMLSRVQFNNHIPDVLKGSERRLRMWRAPNNDASRQRQEQSAQQSEHQDAAEHGLHRWQQGYDLRELTREWGHLQVCLSDELDSFEHAHPQIMPAVLSAARRVMVELCIEGISESVAQYARLQQAEAAGHVGDLQESLDQLAGLEQRRAESLREAAHDLRGNLSVVSGATSMLQREDVPEPLREEFLDLLQNGVASLQHMLNDLMDLARLQAGHEQRKIAPFDAASALLDLCATSQPLAEERDLFLRSDGPPELLVEGDAVKVRRIAQNLLLNALKYTIRGGVSVSWCERDANHWELAISDSGPGLSLGPSAPLADKLQNATQSSREAENKHGNAQNGNAQNGNAPDKIDANIMTPAITQEEHREAVREPGEGIGLSIVKRLCELLDAGLELDSEPGKGSTFHVVLPRSYPKPKEPA